MVLVSESGLLSRSAVVLSRLVGALPSIEAYQLKHASPWAASWLRSLGQSPQRRVFVGNLSQ